MTTWKGIGLIRDRIKASFRFVTPHQDIQMNDTIFCVRTNVVLQPTAIIYRISCNEYLFVFR